MKFATYNAIQVVRNHDCPEPVTVGVFVYFDSDVELRMFGARIGSAKISSTEFCYAFPDLSNADLIYEQWTDWFDCQSKYYKWNRQKVIDKLTKLETRGETLIASVMGKIPITDGESLSETADKLFDDLVMSRSDMRQARFFGRVNLILRQSEVRSIDGFTKDAEVELLGTDNQVRQLLFFPYLWESSRRGRFACKLLWVDDSEHKISSAVSHVMNAFEVAHRTGFLHKDHGIILTSGELPQQYDHLLKSIGKVIEVNNVPMASMELRKLIFN